MPRALIAERPVEPRDAARLLHVGRAGLADRAVLELPSLLRRGDLMVFNDTRVIPALLVGRRGAARIALTLHRREAASGAWRAFAKGAKRLRPSDRIEFAAPGDPSFAAEILG